MGNQKGVIMARKRYTAEQIIGHLRQAEILISEGKTVIEAGSQGSKSELFHRAGQSLGERLRRELQRKTQGRTPQRGNLHNAARGKSVDGSLASRVQSGPTTQFVGLQTTCTRNGLRTVISNHILTLDVDT